MYYFLLPLFKRLGFLLLIGSVGLFSGMFCLGPDCEPDVEKKATMPDYATSFFNFKKGSYWVLQNTMNGRLDSVWVSTEPNIHYISEEGKNQHTYCHVGMIANFSFALSDTTGGVPNRFSLNFERGDSKEARVLFYSCTKEKDTGQCKEADLYARNIVFPAKITSSNYYSLKTHLNKKIDVGMSLNNIPYGKCLSITPLCGYDTLIFAEKVGIIKAFRLDTAYKLVRSHFN